MSSIVQAPAYLLLSGVAGDPFAVTLALVDSSGDPLSGTSSPVVSLTANGASTPDAWAPTVTNPSDGEYLISFTSEQTALIGGAGWSLQWSFSITNNDVGPQACLAGPFAMTPSYQPGSSTTSTQTVTVDLGDNVVDISATFASGTSDATAIQGVTVSSTAPTAGQVLAYSEEDGAWEPTSIDGGNASSS